MSMEWIPVTERLPNDGERVLVSIDHRCQLMMFWRHGDGQGWCGPSGLSSGDVTHWMPLPDPPGSPPPIRLSPDACVWVGRGDENNWSDPVNWKDGRVPKDGDDVACTGAVFNQIVSQSTIVLSGVGIDESCGRG